MLFCINHIYPTFSSYTSTTIWPGPKPPTDNLASLCRPPAIRSDSSSHTVHRIFKHLHLIKKLDKLSLSLSFLLFFVWRSSSTPHRDRAFTHNHGRNAGVIGLATARAIFIDFEISSTIEQTLTSRVNIWYETLLFPTLHPHRLSTTTHTNDLA